MGVKQFFYSYIVEDHCQLKQLESTYIMLVLVYLNKIYFNLFYEYWITNLFYEYFLLNSKRKNNLAI